MIQIQRSYIALTAAKKKKKNDNKKFVAAEESRGQKYFTIALVLQDE